MSPCKVKGEARWGDQRNAAVSKLHTPTAGGWRLEPL